MSIFARIFFLVIVMMATGSSYAHAADSDAVPPQAPVPSDPNAAALSALSRNSAGTSAPADIPIPPPPSTSTAPPAAPGMPALPPPIDNKAPELKLPGEPAAPSPPSIQSLPTLPGAAPAETTAAPAMPPLPGTEAAKEKPAQAPAAEDASKAKKGKAKKHKKGKKKKKKSEQRTAVPYTVVKYRLPEEIYKKSYDRFNRHLPVAYYEKEYDKLMFTTAARNDINGLRSLINEGHDVNQVNEKGDTPLLAAVKNNAAGTAFLLLRHNAEVNALDANGQTPLQIAKRLGNSQLVDILSSFSE